MNTKLKMYKDTIIQLLDKEIPKSVFTCEGEICGAMEEQIGIVNQLSPSLPRIFQNEFKKALGSRCMVTTSSSV